MSLEKKSGSQVACKVIDLQPLYPSFHIGKSESPARAEDVDSRVQMRKLEDHFEKQRTKKKLERELTRCYREVEILATIRHVGIANLKVYR